ncbi:MAG: solute carrier family 26 protein [Anaerolineae bacterium]
MTTTLNKPAALRPAQPGGISRYLPFLNWLVHYRRDDLVGDLLAGLIVAIMLVPQGMAYAMLAGLPPEVGLYASILPLIIYGLLGTSRSLAVGPVAIVSLLVASGITPLAEPGSVPYVQLALTLALLVAVIQLVMGVVKLGFLVNFLSHPVLAGFTSAAAIVIGFSQMKHLLGVSIGRTEVFYEQVLLVGESLPQTNPLTLAIGLGSIAVLFYFKQGLGKHLRGGGISESLLVPVTKAGPLVVVLGSTLLVFFLGLSERFGVKVVGDVPAGLPPLTAPTFDLGVWSALLPTALAISFVGFMESISVAKSLASKKRQKVQANQELIALGAANFGATFTGGFPVTGGFSRSVVNFAAGANTGLASIITALLIGLTVMFLTPLFYFLPNAVLAAIIMVAVAGLIDVKTFRHVWKYNKADALSMIVTFVAVLAVGVESGILVGVAAAILLFVWRTSRPHMAVVGRIGQSETYRNVLRHSVATCPHVVAIRVDQSLYFANTKYLEDTILTIVADRPEVKHLVLIGIAINFIDASALETLESLVYELRGAGVEFYMADIKGPVMDRLKAIGFVAHLGEDHFFLSTHDAMLALNCTGNSQA